MSCRKCGASVDGEMRFCPNCGVLLTTESPRLSNFSNDKLNEEKEEFYKAIIGPRNQKYYLRQFLHFDHIGKTTYSWHWPALFVPFLWFLYRKMWLTGFTYLFLPGLVLVSLGSAASAIGPNAKALVGAIYVLFLVGYLAFPPLYANALYYKRCNRKISEVTSMRHGFERERIQLSREGGTSRLTIYLLLFVVVFGIVAAVSISAYDDYTTRSQVAQAAAVGNRAGESVAKYYFAHNRMPSSLAQAGFAPEPMAIIKEMGIDSQTGTIFVTMGGQPLEGKKLLFFPSINQTGSGMVWECSTREIDTKYLASQCRNSNDTNLTQNVTQ